MHPHRPLSSYPGILHPEHVPLRSATLHWRSRNNVLHRTCTSRHRLRHNFPGNEHALHQPRTKQPACYRNKHISDGMGRRHWHRHSHKRTDCPALHVLHGLPYRFGALPCVNDLLQHKSHPALQQKQVKMIKTFTMQFTYTLKT